MSAIDGLASPRLRRALRAALPRAVAASLSTLSFWFAIVLPAIYLPLLASGIRTTDRLVLFLALFGLHVLALVGGRPYLDRAGH